MKYLTRFTFAAITLFLMILLTSSFSITIGADEDPIRVDALYFASNTCDICLQLAEDGVIQMLEDQGYNVQKYYLDEDSKNIDILRNYQFTYDIPLANNQIPVLFVGSTYFIGRTAIRDGILNNEIQLIMDSQDLLPMQIAVPSDFSLIYFILLGFIDGINPCAIAMLLMFISLLSFTSNKKVLIKVSFTFIAAIFISYFLFGTFLYRFLSQFSSGAFLVKFVPWIIIVIAGFLFLLNAYDFVITTLQRYDKVKNQLPKGIQKFNRKLMNAFNKKINEGSSGLYILTFAIGIIVSFTEFLCTGQAYFTAILHLIHYTNFIGRGVILLLIYNLIFVLPLIIISAIAVKTQSIASVSAFMRERLNLIKLLNALVFLAILLYYIFFMI